LLSPIIIATAMAARSVVFSSRGPPTSLRRCSWPHAAVAADHRVADDDHESTAGFAGFVELEQSEVDELFQNGYVVIDEALTSEESGKLEMAMGLLDDGFMLQPEEQAGRDDAIRFVDEAIAMLPIAAAMQRLKAIGEGLQPTYAMALADSGSSPWAAPWTRIGEPEALEPREPATRERLLTASTMAQLASYGPDGVYCVHSDNSRDELGRRRNERALTAIVYATPSDWSVDKDGGCLRIWTGTDEVDCNMEGDPATFGEALQADGVPHVDIAPLQGRAVIFRSTLLHEVRPTKRRPRRAVTQWFFAPFK